MAENAIFTVVYNRNIAKDVFEMRLSGPTGSITAPGQFLNVSIAGFYLRRPISICDWDGRGLTIIYKILGRGTAQMAHYSAGTELDVLVGLGNGFSIEAAKGKNVVLAGGGVGVPPLFGLAKRLAAIGQPPKVALGFRTAEDVFYEKDFLDLGCEVAVATEDGSAGLTGFVTTALDLMEYNHYCACGPQPMLAAVFQLGKRKGASGQLSFEERMGCGFGACMGCSCETLVGTKRVCVDGPVFPSEEVSLP